MSGRPRMGAEGEDATGAHAHHAVSTKRAHLTRPGNKSLPLMPTAEEQQDWQESEQSECSQRTTADSSREEPPLEKNIMQKLMSGPYAQVCISMHPRKG